MDFPASRWTNCWADCKRNDEMTDLNKIKLAYSPLSDRIVLYRHGKDPALALDKRESEQDVMTALVDYMMHGTSKGSEKDVRIGDTWYTVRVTPKVSPNA